jgi:hypothetical protein
MKLFIDQKFDKQATSSTKKEPKNNVIMLLNSKMIRVRL